MKAAISPAPRASSAPRIGTQATAAGEGTGFDNYRRLIDYGEGFWRYFANSVIVGAIKA
jgi:ABC-type glycerol-3-phosphate transport system permease component